MNSMRAVGLSLYPLRFSSLSTVLKNSHRAGILNPDLIGGRRTLSPGPLLHRCARMGEIQVNEI